MAVNSGVELLLAKGADVNPKDDYGNTALKMAAKRRGLEIIELLLSEGNVWKGTITHNGLKIAIIFTYDSRTATINDFKMTCEHLPEERSLIWEVVTPIKVMNDGNFSHQYEMPPDKLKIVSADGVSLVLVDPPNQMIEGNILLSGKASGQLIGLVQSKWEVQKQAQGGGK